MRLTGIIFVGINENTGVNCHPHISKGETLIHQVETLDEIKYIKSKDGDTKIQQDRLFVSIPLIELRDDSRKMRERAHWSGQGFEEIEREIKVRESVNRQK